MDASGTPKHGNALHIVDRSKKDGVGPLVEAPKLVNSLTKEGCRENLYMLFLLVRLYKAPSYNIKYAAATNIRGPYTRGKNILLKIGMWIDLQALGSADVMWDEDGWSGR